MCLLSNEANTSDQICRFLFLCHFEQKDVHTIQTGIFLSFSTLDTVNI